MIVLAILALLTIVFLFALSSISQSYASARQAQAVIETARAAEIAGIGNLVGILVLALVVIAVLGVGILFFLRLNGSSRQSSRKTINPQVAPANPANLDQFLTLLVVQMLQNQMEQNASQLYIPPAQVDDETEDHDLWLLP